MTPRGFVPRRGVAPGPLAAAPVSRERALEVIEACEAPRVLFGAPDLARLAYYDQDPRGRRLLAIEEEGRVTALAMTFLSAVVTAQGIERVATLDSVFLPSPTADRLSALVFAAAAAFAGEATSPAVSAPSLATLDAEVVRAARLRATGTAFEASVCHPEGHPFGGAEATNLEVV